LVAWSEKPFGTDIPSLVPREVAMRDILLTPAQEAEAQRLAALVGKKAEAEALTMMRILVGQPDHQLLGAAEYEVRDRAHHLAAHALETALNERKKGGTKVPASSAPTAKQTPVS
jgi:hypothetical protein